MDRPNFSISSGTVPTAPKLGGWVSLGKTMGTTQLGTNAQWSALSGHFTALE